MVSALFLGLSDDARTKMHISGNRLTVEQMLMAMMVDSLNLLVWQNTKDATKGRNKPKSVLQMLTGDQGEKEKDFEVFDSLADFEQARRKILEGKK